MTLTPEQMTLTPEQMTLTPEQMTLTPEQSLTRMWAAADQFYGAAVNTNCHAFIEFTGLLREYCKICEANLKRGIDFRELNAHRSERMEVQEYEVDYFNEKLNCIFQGLLKVERLDEGVSSDD
jgi:hypothetical protein